MCINTIKQEETKEPCGRRHSRERGCLKKFLPLADENPGTLWGNFDVFIEGKPKCPRICEHLSTAGVQALPQNARRDPSPPAVFGPLGFFNSLERGNPDDKEAKERQRVNTNKTFFTSALLYCRGPADI